MEIRPKAFFSNASQQQGTAEAIKSVSNVFIFTGLTFAQLTIVSNTFARNQITINKLWKSDAILMRRIIEGLRLFISKDIDTTDYSVTELVSKLKQLSTTDIVL